jgi:hypothetical protein
MKIPLNLPLQKGDFSIPSLEKGEGDFCTPVGNSSETDFNVALKERPPRE